MESSADVACPVCTLYLRPGITLENHLTSHPKQKVIEALIRAVETRSSDQQNVNNSIEQQQSSNMIVYSPTNTVSTNVNQVNKISTVQQQQTSNMAVFSPINSANSNLNQMGSVPTNHSFIYQQFMSSSGTQPMINVNPNMNPMNPQFITVPTVFNPQMYCSPPYIFQQQQQVQIVSAAATTNFRPLLPKVPKILSTPSSGVSINEVSDPLQITKIYETRIASELTENSSDDVINSKRSKERNNRKIDSSSKSPLKIVTPRSSHENTFSVNYGSESDTSIPADITEEENLPKDCTIKESNKIIDRPNIIFETKNDEIVSVTISGVNDIAPCRPDESKNLVEEVEELNKACQTIQTQIIKDVNSKEDNDVIIGDKSDIFEDMRAIPLPPRNKYESNQEIVVDTNNDLQTSGENNIAVLEMNDINFILPNDFIQNGQSIITKIANIETVEPIDRPSILMNMEDVKDSKLIEQKFFEKIDEECLSHESLNIRADEKMPPRGELSEQESNGASEIGWGSRIYQEGSSGMSTSYDLLARESWEASDCSDLEMPPLQSRIQPPNLDYKSDDADDPDSEEPPTFEYNCLICGESFRCPKERRVHQTKEHATPPPLKRMKITKKVFKKSRTIRKEKISNNNVDNDFIKKEPKIEPKIEEQELIVDDLKEEAFEIIDEKESLLCNYCGELIPTLTEWNIHNKKVHNIRPINQNLVCRTCNEAFTTPNEYADHLKVHPLECHICGKYFYKVPNLKIHIKRHTGIRPHKCDVCSKSFFAKQKLQEHMNIHNGLSPIKCTMCNETFRRYSNLVQHRNRHHLNIKKKIKDYICFCGEIYHSRNKLNWHKETHDAKPKSCNFCHEKFIHMASLTRHIRRAHNQRYVPEERRKNENVECEVCKGVYLKTSLEAHLLTHSGKKQYACLICNKEFTTKWNLKLHKWTHAAATMKPYKCEICQAAFIRQTEYTSHMNSHKSIRPYTCNYCGCKFIRKYNCLRHVREHEEGKSFVCTVCDKSFHRSYYLKEHMRVHTGLRPFACHICGKTSTTKSNHNKHMKIHHAREAVMTEG